MVAPRGVPDRVASLGDRLLRHGDPHQRRGRAAVGVDGRARLPHAVHRRRQRHGRSQRRGRRSPEARGADVAYRRAVALAYDKRRYYSELFQETGAFPSITGPFLPGVGAYNSAVEDYKWQNRDCSNFTYEERLSAARSILSSMGILQNLEVMPDMDFIHLKSDDNIGKTIEAGLKKLGLKINRIKLEKVQFDERRKQGNFDLILWEWSSGLNPGVDMWEPRNEKLMKPRPPRFKG